MSITDNKGLVSCEKEVAKKQWLIRENGSGAVSRNRQNWFKWRGGEKTVKVLGGHRGGVGRGMLGESDGLVAPAAPALG